MNLSDRLDRIEAKLRPTKDEDLTMWIRLVSPGHLDRPVSRIKRQPGVAPLGGRG
jgi:hypothetical protein